MSSKKDKQIAQSRHEDEVLNRALLWIGGAAILIAFILFLNRYYVHYRTTEVMFAAAIAKALPIVVILGLVGCVAGAFLAHKAKLAKKSMKWLVALSVLCFGLAVCAGLAWRFSGTGTQFLCAVILATAVLALVYYLYQHEFFVISLSAAVGIVGLWLVRRAAGTSYTSILYGYLVLAAAFLLVVALGARKLQENGGEWKGRRLFHKKAAYPLVYLTCGIVAALLVAAVLLGASVAYYLIFVAVAWLVVMAVYFTVKLM